MKIDKNEATLYLYALAYIAVFTLSIATTTVVLHELGHFYLGLASGCENARIVMLDEGFGTYTQMNCNVSEYVLNLISLGGFLLVVPFCLLIYALKNYDKYYSLIALGFNLIISSSDISMFSHALSYFSLVLGSSILLYGENLLINRYMFYTETMGMISSYFRK